MNLVKATKRITKKVKMGFQGYPEISIAYSGPDENTAKQVTITYTAEDGAEPMHETFHSQIDAREDEVIQSAIVKMIERTDALSVRLSEQITVSP